MKLFDQKVNQLLNEMPHISFNTNTEMAGFDFKIEMYDDSTYDEFMNRIKTYYADSDENKKQEFLKEIKSQNNPAFTNFFRKKFPARYGKLNNEAIIDQFIKEITQ